ncbi:MAG: hypothetical protein PVJ76_05870 [Gemmatimonadota bacterium]|jgi:hypothetical protein
MSEQWLEAGEVSVFVVPKVKKKFDEGLARLLKKELGEPVEPLRLDDDLTTWVADRAAGKNRSKGQKSPAAKALWRAFRALAAARYHLKEDLDAEKELRALRDRVESLWMERAP